MENKKLEAYLLLLIAVFGWALNLVFGRYLHDQIPPFGISFWRWAIAVGILSLIFWKRFIPFLHLVGKHFRHLLLLSIFGIVVGSSFQYVGLKYTSVTNAGIIITLMPIFIALCAEIILKEKTSSLQKIGMMVALLGALVIISQGRMANIRNFDFNIGDLILVIAAFAWGIYTALLKKYKIPCTDWELVQATGFVSLIIITVILFAQGKTEVTHTFTRFSWSSVFALAYIGTGASLLSFWAWNKGVEIVGGPDAGIFLYLMPVLSAILAAIFLDERLHTYHFFGALVIIVGVYLTLKGGQKVTHKPA